MSVIVLWSLRRGWGWYAADEEPSGPQRRFRALSYLGIISFISHWLSEVPHEICIKSPTRSEFLRKCVDPQQDDSCNHVSCGSKPPRHHRHYSTSSDSCRDFCGGPHPWRECWLALPQQHPVSALIAASCPIECIRPLHLRRSGHDRDW